jgi:hypothetical protein
MRNRGVDIDGGQIISSGANLEVTGGDNNTGVNAGVSLASGGQIRAGGSGTVIVQGTGGASSATNSGFSDGVSLNNTDTRIASEDGDVTVTGNSSAPFATSCSYGVKVGSQASGAGAANISAGGLGSLTINGGATGASNPGVFVDLNSSVSASGGALQITGTAASHFGVLALSSGAIPNPTGNVTLISDRLGLQGHINAGTNTVTLRQKTDGVDI